MPVGIYKNNNNYSLEEIDLFKKYYPISTCKELVLLFPNRNKDSLKMFAHKNGIKKDKVTLYKCRSEAMTGRKISKSFIKKMVKNAKEIWKREGYREKMSELHRLPERKIILSLRNHFKSRDWRESVFKRDKYTCQECKKRGGKLNAHHIKKFVDIFKENNIKTIEEGLLCNELWDLKNGITLCNKCHRKTNNYGNRDTVAVTQA